MAADVARDLRAAAEVLERDGWTQGVYGDERGCRCQAGAMIVAVSGQPWMSLTSLTPEQFGRWTTAERFFHRFLDAEPMGWNDEPGRTAAEVIAALLAAADAAEAEL